MKLLEEKIVNDGVIKSGNVLKVDSFLNHQIDVPFVAELGKELKRLFADRNITKILTIEASGIGIACVAAMYFGVPVVFAKKSSGSNMDKDVYFTQIYSYTHSKTNDVVEGVGVAVEKGFQGGGDKLRKAGYNLHSLAIIDKMDAKTNTVVFRHEKA